ncbi:hypothetical protein [uncultured Pelagimonas sp.]|uniref:hypothetical protein n=1 Tax=uncultured Pelagimonas sp. TaxID=1618102 RepID=UPI0026299FCA|nr:hypothetical protein [uncultured Pelagimonas sp.]
MSEKLKVVGAKALLDKPVLRVIRGDEANSSPPTTPDPSWDTDQLNQLNAIGATKLNEIVTYPHVGGDFGEFDPEGEAIEMRIVAKN